MGGIYQSRLSSLKRSELYVRLSMTLGLETVYAMPCPWKSVEGVILIIFLKIKTPSETLDLIKNESTV